MRRSGTVPRNCCEKWLMPGRLGLSYDTIEAMARNTNEVKVVVDSDTGGV